MSSRSVRNRSCKKNVPETKKMSPKKPLPKRTKSKPRAMQKTPKNGENPEPVPSTSLTDSTTTPIEDNETKKMTEPVPSTSLADPTSTLIEDNENSEEEDEVEPVPSTSQANPTSTPIEEELVEPVPSTSQANPTSIPIEEDEDSEEEDEDSEEEEEDEDSEEEDEVSEEEDELETVSFIAKRKPTSTPIVENENSEEEDENSEEEDENSEEEDKVTPEVMKYYLNAYKDSPEYHNLINKRFNTGFSFECKRRGSRKIEIFTPEEDNSPKWRENLPSIEEKIKGEPGETYANIFMSMPGLSDFDPGHSDFDEDEQIEPEPGETNANIFMSIPGLIDSDEDKQIEPEPKKKSSTKKGRKKRSFK